MSGSILVIEDERLVAENVVAILRQAGLSKTFITDNKLEASSFYKAHPVQLIISDINLNGPDTGPDIVRILHQDKFVPVIYLSAYAEEQIVDDALKTQPAAYVVKPFTERQLLVAVKMALKTPPELPIDTTILPPTAREVEIIRCLSEGMSSRKISEKLFISEYTVNTHRRNLLKRYALDSTSELITLSIKQKWIKI